VRRPGVEGLSWEDEMKKALLLVVAVAFSLSCASGDPEPQAETVTQAEAAAPSGVPDSEIGLAPGTAFDQPPQAPIAFNTVDPGDSELQARPNAEFPPVIPHSVAELEAITRTENPCLDCHGVEAARYSEAVAVPPSHHVDLRRSPDTQGDEPAGARWLCTSCHVAQTDAQPLVANSSGSS
jgi:cytochrome c-type protein NapB